MQSIQLAPDRAGEVKEERAATVPRPPGREPAGSGERALLATGSVLPAFTSR